MNIQYVDGELDVFEDGEDGYTSGGMFNFCETQAGNTLTINAFEYEIIPDENLAGVFILKKIKKKEDKK